MPETVAIIRLGSLWSPAAREIRKSEGNRQKRFVKGLLVVRRQARTLPTALFSASPEIFGDLRDEQ
jgi:hypothetical protein